MTIHRGLISLLLAAALCACSQGSHPAAVPTDTGAAQPTVPSTAAIATATPAAPSPTQTPAGSAPTLPAPTSAAEPGNSQPSSGEQEGQPVEVKGSFTFTNDIILRYYVEHAISLTDMYGFVIRDKEWEIPVTSQNLGFLKMDVKNKSGTFDIQLPARPEGKFADVNPDGKDEKGVQIFAADYSPNLSGGPYAEGDDPSQGWPSYLASVRTDSENNDEVVGGMLMVWSPDGSQFFPSGFGADGLLFTADDPVMPVPAGYTAIDMEKTPFKQIRQATVEMTLYEPADAAIKDFSTLSYSEAFDKMFEIVRKEYAFNGIEGKQPDWDAVYAKVSPMVKAAEAGKDAEAYFRALRDFTLAFHDGHVGMSAGDLGRKVIMADISGGYGFAVRQLDDGKVMTVYVVEGGPAEKAGMQVGAVISQFGGKPVEEALKAVRPPDAPYSMPSKLRFEQARYLVRAPVGSKTQVTFTNPSGAPKTVELTATGEQDSMQATSPYRNIDPNGLPVEYVVASSSIGYIRITSNYDDLNLIVRLFQRAMDKFEENGITTLIIDMRGNSGGANLGLAGFLTDKEIPLGQLQYYSDKTGKFEAERPQDRMHPNEKQYHFEKMYLLIDQACASACELESYTFSKVPGMVVIGETSTAGTEAEVSRGQFHLPEEIKLQIPTGRFVLPDGSIFLEGKGVEPTERVPVNEDTVLSQQDPLIQRAVQLSRQ